MIRQGGILTQQNAGAPNSTIISGAGYLPFGPLEGFTYGNGIALALSYDQDYQLTGIDAGTGSAVVQNLTDAYDPAGNVLSIVDGLDGARSQAFTYDDLNRVLTGTGLYGDLSYTYDGVGNRLTDSNGSSTDDFTYPANSNQISTIVNGTNTRTLTYLPSGQTTEDMRSPTVDDTFSYDDAGRLTTAAANGSAVATYLYNAFGQRVQKVAGTTTIQFVYDRQGHLVEEADASGSPQREYIWLDDRPVAMVDDTGASPTLYYVHDDHLGRPQKITDGSANIVWDGVFDPFGNATSIGGTITNYLRFPGQYYDSETQLSQNWFRDYDATIGRYIESDPIGIAGGLSTYGYAAGNPVVRTDQDGQQAILLVLGAAAFLSAELTPSPANAPGPHSVIYPSNDFAPLVNGIAPALGSGIGLAASGLGECLAGVAAEGLGDLTAGEIKAIQGVVDEAGRPLDVVGSAASGARRGVGTDLPIGKGPGTQSDIDYIAPPSSHPYFNGLEGRLPSLDPETGIIPGSPNPNIGPSIRFEPGASPYYVPGH